MKLSQTTKNRIDKKIRELLKDKIFYGSIPISIPFKNKEGNEIKVEGRKCGIKLVKWSDVVKGIKECLEL